MKYRFDQAVNKETAEESKKSESGAERAKNPDEQNSGITATVEGALRVEQIDVTSITVH